MKDWLGGRTKLNSYAFTSSEKKIFEHETGHTKLALGKADQEKVDK